jgi:uncharacterized membrane protein YphA (DoxX/SURF4 family)
MQPQGSISALVPAWLPWWGASLLVCLPFIVSVVCKLRDRAAAYEELAAGGFPRSPLLLAAVIATQAAGIALILSGAQRAIGAALLAAFLFAATVLYHRFWRERGSARIVALNHFAENLALIGALGLIALAG